MISQSGQYKNWFSDTLLFIESKISIASCKNNHLVNSRPETLLILVKHAINEQRTSKGYRKYSIETSGAENKRLLFHKRWQRSSVWDQKQRWIDKEQERGWRGLWRWNDVRKTRTPVYRCFVGTLHKTSQSQEPRFKGQRKEAKLALTVFVLTIWSSERKWNASPRKQNSQRFIQITQYGLLQLQFWISVGIKHATSWLLVATKVSQVYGPELLQNRH